MNNLKQRGATLVQRASAKIAGFKALHKRLEKKIIVSGKSQSTLANYVRCVAHVAYPTPLDLEQIILHSRPGDARVESCTDQSL